MHAFRKRKSEKKSDESQSLINPVVNKNYGSAIIDTSSLSSDEIQAVRDRNFAVLKKINNINKKDPKTGKTLLHFALSAPHDVFDFLIQDKEIDVNAVDKDSSTPLHAAVQAQDYPAVEKLLGKGAKVDARDKTDSTPLHIAAEKGNLEIARLLIANKAGVNLLRKRHDNGPRIVISIESPLSILIAKQGGHKEFAQLLLQNGADIKTKLRYWDTGLGDSGQITMHEYAEFYGSRAIIEAIQEKLREDRKNKAENATSLLIALTKKVNDLEGELKALKLQKSNDQKEGKLEEKNASDLNKFDLGMFRKV